jgi:imidazole glycerol-phosphate synthase subunit HisF
MLTRRIIPCLDVKHGRVVKGVQFQALRDIGDPVELACRYEAEGADELVFLDISASAENQPTLLNYVRAVAQQLSIPFAVGGGVRTLADAEQLLAAGADKVSVNTAAVSKPDLITAIASEFGAQCCVLAIDARRRSQAAVPHHPENDPDNDPEPVWDVLTHGGRTTTGLNALTWAMQAVERGAGEILLTSWDADGTRQGFDIALTQTFTAQLPVPVIASGGARDAASFTEVFQVAGADAALAASIFHDGDMTVMALKQALHHAGVTVRLTPGSNQNH